MKKYIFTLSLILVFAVFFDIAKAANPEVIQNFVTDIEIQKDGSLNIIENITYDFDTNQKHGIFRDIALTAKDGPNLVINVSDVIDENGKYYNYVTSTDNDILHIKIGDADKLVSGIKTYVINYNVHNAIRSFEGHDELYWNLTGIEWNVGIENAHVSVTLPDSSIKDVRMDCFTGKAKSTENNCSFAQKDGSVNYSTTLPLGANEGLTLVLGIPVGYIDNVYVEPQYSNSFENSSFDAMSFAFGIFFLFYIAAIVTISVKKSSKPNPIIPRELKGQPVVVEYRPPNKLSPIEIGTVLDRRVDITDISSIIIDLAIKGYLKIRYTVKEISFFPDKKCFEFIKLKNGEDLTHPAYKAMFHLLFRDKNSVVLSELETQKKVFRSDIKKINEKTDKKLYDDGYFDKAAKRQLEKNWKQLFMVILVLFLLIFISSYFFMALSPIFILLVCIFGFFSVLRNAKLNHKLTEQGLTTLKKIIGFKEFLELTEKDKLELLNAPELKPEMFEEFLPYAMVLGVENKWAEKFEGIYETAPNWYEDPTMQGFNSTIFVHSIGQFNTSFNGVFASTSTSSSGFSGGSSGGGSGGGGGGSW